MIINGDAAQVAAAFVAARAEMQTSIKNDAKGVYNNYPTLRKVVDTITPFLKDNGLTFSQEPASSDSGVGVSTTIMHASGATIEFGTLIMPIADKKPQTVGSAITYAKRYALTSIFGLVGTDDDDDGLAAQASTEPLAAAPPRDKLRERDSYKQKPKPVASKADDSMWEPESATPKKPDTLSQSQMARLHIVGVELYGKEEWEERRPELVKAASKGAVTSSKELTPDEADVLIRGIEKKLATIKANPSVVGTGFHKVVA